MKFIIVANEFFNLYNFRKDLIYKILKKYPKIEIILAARFDGYEHKLFQDDEKITKININFYSRSMSFNKNIYSFISLLLLFLREKPTLVISYTIKPNLFFLIFKFFLDFKLIINITGLGEIFLSNNKKLKYIFKLFKKILNKANFVIFQNNADLNMLTKNNLNLKKKCKVIFGSGINRSKFRFTKPPNQKKISFLFVGRIIKEKGIIELLRSIIKFKKKYKSNCEFVLIGDVYKDNFIFNDLFFHLIKISKIKYIRHTLNIEKYIRDSHCIILPSYREGLSKFLIEAISIGRMVITTNVPGCKELVTNYYNGFICEPKSYNSLFLSMEKVYNYNFKKIDMMCKNSYLKSSIYSEEKINFEYINIIDKILLS